MTVNKALHRPISSLTTSVLVVTFLCNLYAEDRSALKYDGVSRARSKTSIVRTVPSNDVKSPLSYTSVKKLLSTLKSNTFIKTKYKGQSKIYSGKRMPEELKNVEFDCWIHGVAFEDDNDFHVIAGTTDKMSDDGFMTLEIAGLPDTVGDNLVRLTKARKDFIQIINSFSVPDGGDFIHLIPPIKVHITGSLFFDFQHCDGCGSMPGPSWAKPKKLWEIHPVYDIRVTP